MLHLERGFPFLFASLLVLVPASGHALELRGSLAENGHTHYVPPVSNPLFNETPYITTEARPVYLHQELPDGSLTNGGNIDLVALELRAALTERLGFIASKDGWADVDFDAVLPDDDGFVNLSFGFKYAVLSDPATDAIATLGIEYEAPTGSIETAGVDLQGGGDGLLDVFAAGAKRFGKLGLEANLGGNLAIDSDHDTSMLHYSVHADYELLACLFGVLELNGFTVVDDADRTPVNFEGMDLVNVGATDAGTVVTVAPGVRARLHDHVLWGAAVEVPITDNQDLLDWRVITDFVFHL